MFILIFWTNFWVAGCGDVNWRVRETSTEVLFWVADENTLRKDYADLEVAHRAELVLDRRKRIQEQIDEITSLINFKYDRMKKFMKIKDLRFDTPWFEVQTEVPEIKLLFVLCKFALEDFGIETYLYETRFGIPVPDFFRMNPPH